VKNPDPAPLVGEQATEAVAETRHVEPRRPMQLRVKPVPEEAPETDNIFRDEDPAMFTHGGQVARRDTTLVAPRPAEAMGDRG
jgi:hypothetical protein